MTLLRKGHDIAEIASTFRSFAKHYAREASKQRG
jgi:hypothetical protein